MKKIFERWPVNVRVAAYSLGIFILCNWALAIYLDTSLRAGVERLVGEQQRAAAKQVAVSLDRHVKERLATLEAVARFIGPSIKDGHRKVQFELEQHAVFDMLFNGGVFVIDDNGIAIASLPVANNRIGVSYMDRDFIIAALKEGRASVGRPVIGKQMHRPSVAMAVPVRDSRGRVVGVLAGVTDLTVPSFLDVATANRPDKGTNQFLLFHAKSA